MKTLFIINEKAGSLSVETVEKSIRHELRSYPAKVQSQIGILVCHDIETLRSAIETHHNELERVIAVGGDGTIVEVISAIINYPDILLGIIPLGTGNRLASNLGIPPHVKGAVETAIKGTPHRIDIGRINGRYFALMAGAGLDAEIMDKVQPIEKKTMGVLAYFWKGVQRAFRTPYAIFEIEADEVHLRCRGIGVVIANAGNLLGRYFTLTPGAKPDDGLLDICVLASRKRTDYWTSMIQILSRETRGVHEEGIRHLRAKNIKIRSRPRVKVQADGDVIGFTPIEIQALPEAVGVLVPAQKGGGGTIGDSLHYISEHVKLMVRDMFHI